MWENTAELMGVSATMFGAPERGIVAAASFERRTEKGQRVGLGSGFIGRERGCVDGMEEGVVITALSMQA